MALGCAALAALSSRAARADDWLTARHDGRRTGRSTGATRLTAPAIRWRHYLGGSVRASNLVTTDVDRDGVTDVVYVAAGKVICKHADDALVWESPLVDVRQLAGVADLDGDMRPEVVAVGTRGFVGVFAGDDGRLLWEVPVAARGLSGTARVFDVDGDGLPDVYVGQCVNNPISAAAYSFRGNRTTPRELWRVATLPDNGCGTDADVAGDLDGNGSPEVVIAQGYDRMYVVDGATGIVRSELMAPASGPFRSYTTLMLRQLDADPALELLAFTNGYSEGPPAVGSRRIIRYDHDPAGPGRLRATWVVDLSNVAGTDLRFDPTGVRDLDGDGAAEVLTGEYDLASRATTLVVRSAADGRVLTRVANAELEGVVDGPGARPWVLTVDEDRALSARTLTGTTLAPAWTLPGYRTLRHVDPGLLARERAAAGPLQVQLDDDLAPELVLARFDPNVPLESRVVTEVAGFDTGGAQPRMLGSYMAPTGVTVIAASKGAELSRPWEQTVLVTSDGYLLALDRALAPTNRVVSAEFTIPGMRVGGFYATGLGPTPVAGSFSAAMQDRGIVVRDSRPALLRLDVAGASLATPPRVRWERPNLSQPIMLDVDGDQVREVVVVDVRDVVALDAATGMRERWRSREAAGPRGSQALYDLTPLRRADGTSDVFVARLDPGLVYRPTALRGTDGSVRWNTLTRTARSGAGSFSLGDLTGDGTDDVFGGVGAMLVVNGTDGTVAVEQGGAPYAQGIIAPFSGTENEVWVGGAFSADRLVTRGLSVRGELANNTFSAPHGALTRCADAPAVVLTPFLTADLVTVRPQSLPASGPPGAAVLASATFAGGRRFERAADVPAGVRAGTFTGLAAVADLDGRGTEGVLAASTDGWLYALDACSLALRWAHDFHYPVGDPVVADTDGDGTDDVAVSVGDGFLYGLAARTLEAPATVLDLSPPGEADVDEVETFDALSASWSPVAGATSYLVRPLTAAGTALRFPESVAVSGTRVELQELLLRVGGRYRIGVTAIRADGSSVEALSDGVTVVDRAPPTITITRSRNLFRPRAMERVDLTVEVADRTGLVRNRTEIRSPSNAVVRVLEDYDPRARYAARTLRATWGGTDDSGALVPDGTYTVVATATDVGNHTTRQTATVDVGAPSATTVPGSGGAGPAATGGCDCDAVGARVAGGRWMWALALLTVLRRRRRAA
ncbi:MAG: hypothetical protein U0324_44745 [Polyangiales bacterium]